MTAAPPGPDGDGSAAAPAAAINVPAPREPLRPISAADLRSAFDNAPIGMAVVTPTGVITGCNAALGRLLDRPPQDLIGGTFFDHTHPDDLPGAYRSCAQMATGAVRVMRHECRFLRSCGSVVWVLVSTSWVPEAPSRAAHLIMHIEDTSERKALEAELVHRALHDPLTGLANRTLLAERIGTAMTGRRPRPHCLLYVDLDGFKGVNDRYGHSVGDEILVEFARRMTALLRPEDTAARLGGDEFAILCVDTEPRHADLIAERLRAAAAEPFAVDGHTVSVSATIGIGVGTSGLVGGGRQLVDPADLLRQADRHMYETKRRRRS